MASMCMGGKEVSVCLASQARMTNERALAHGDRDRRPVAFRSVRFGIDVRCRVIVICRAQGGKIVAMGEDDTKIYWVSKEALKHIEQMRL
jgi:ketosteroid isomerase-like protein